MQNCYNEDCMICGDGWDMPLNECFPVPEVVDDGVIISSFGVPRPKKEKEFSKEYVCEPLNMSDDIKIKDIDWLIKQRSEMSPIEFEREYVCEPLNIPKFHEGGIVDPKDIVRLDDCVTPIIKSHPSENVKINIKIKSPILDEEGIQKFSDELTNKIMKILDRGNNSKILTMSSKRKEKDLLEYFDFNKIKGKSPDLIIYDDLLDDKNE